MSIPRRKFVSIAGLSDQRRIPRLGRIRLGHLNHNTQSETNYPIEDSFFHVPPEVAKVYGDRPTELDIMIPVNDRSVIFPQALEYWGGSRRLLCTGDGKQATRWDSKLLSMQPTDCPCDLYGNGCKERAHLQVILPKVKSTGMYQIDTSSSNSIITINSFLDMLAPEDHPEYGILGYFAMVPLKLRRVSRDIYPKGIHRKTYPLELVLDIPDEDIPSWKAKRDDILATTRRWIVQTPEQSNPEDDRDAIIMIDGKKPEDPADPVLVEAPIPTLAPEGPTEDPGSMPTQSPVAAEVQPLTPPAQDSSQPDNGPHFPAPTSPLEQAASATVAAPQPSEPPAAPVRNKMSPAQLNRILKRTRTVDIPDQVIKDHTVRFTTTQASQLINQVDAGDFSAFERRETKTVALPATV